VVGRRELKRLLRKKAGARKQKERDKNGAEDNATASWSAVAGGERGWHRFRKRKPDR
jgi:hypothetical protein